jgi:hypothetical protein
MGKFGTPPNSFFFLTIETVLRITEVVLTTKRHP